MAFNSLLFILTMFASMKTRITAVLQFIPDPESKVKKIRIPDPDPHQRTVSKFSEI
jgi:hypothetical protein